MSSISLGKWLVLVCLFSLGLNGLKSVQAQVLTNSDQVVILDANETIVGPVFSRVGYSASLIFYVNPFVVPVTIQQNKISADFPAWFESTDCSGNPVIDAIEDTGIPFDAQMVVPATIVAQVIPNQDVLGKVYVADPNDTPHSVTVQSIASDPTGCIENENRPAVVVNTIELIDLDVLFTPPFKAAVIGQPKKGGGPKK